MKKIYLLFPFIVLGCISCKEEKKHSYEDNYRNTQENMFVRILTDQYQEGKDAYGEYIYLDTIQKKAYDQRILDFVDSKKLFVNWEGIVVGVWIDEYYPYESIPYLFMRKDISVSEELEKAQKRKAEYLKMIEADPTLLKDEITIKITVPVNENARLHFYCTFLARRVDLLDPENKFYQNILNIEKGDWIYFDGIIKKDENKIRCLDEYTTDTTGLLPQQQAILTFLDKDRDKSKSRRKSNETSLGFFLLDIGKDKRSDVLPKYLSSLINSDIKFFSDLEKNYKDENQTKAEANKYKKGIDKMLTNLTEDEKDYRNRFFKFNLEELIRNKE